MQNSFQDLRLKETVISVVKNIFPRQHLENTATIIAKLKPLEEEDVYSVTTTNGVFLANNVLVSNCDALRYALYSKPVAPEKDLPTPKYKGGDPLYFKPWWEKEKTVEDYNDKIHPIG